MKAENGLFRRWAWLPIPAFLAGMLALWVSDPRGVYESPILVLELSYLFSTLPALFLAFWIGRSFLVHGPLGLLPLVGGLVIWGVAAPAALAAGPGDVNIQITVHNACVWLSALIQLSGAILSIRSRRTIRSKGFCLGACLAIAMAAVGVVVLLTRADWLPVFFIQGQGGTLVRQLVLGSAIALFALTAVLLLNPAASSPSGADRPALSHWYSLALLLIAAGLAGVTIQSVAGGALGWTGRAAQYLGGVYMFVAVISGRRESVARLRLLQPGGNDAPYRYGVALASVLCAAAIRLMFLSRLETHAAFVTLFPAVILAALYGGLRAGLLATLLSAIVADFFWLAPTGQFFPKHAPDLASLAVFVGVCALIIWIVESLRQAQARVVAAEAEVGIAAERQRAAELLRESEARLKRAQEIAQLGSWELDVVRNRLTWSDEVYRIFGLAPQAFDATYEAFLERVHPDDREAVNAAYTGSLSEKRDTYEIEHRIVRKDNGEIRVVHEKCEHFRDASGAVVRSVGMVHDITSRKQADDQLRETAAELQAANDTLRQSRVAAINLMEDALEARHQAERAAEESRESAKQLQAGNDELEQFNQAMVGRELRMLELKKQVNDLCGRLGEPPAYEVEPANEG